MSAQQLTLELDDARTSTVAVWDALPAETRMLVVLGAGRAGGADAGGRAR